VTAPLRLTEHPVQRAGAWAAAALAKRPHPEEVTVGDLDRLARRLVEEVVGAATAGKDDAGYDWWKVLFALYPNSKATHSGRSRDREELTPAIAALFSADTAEKRLWPCAFCGVPSSVVWTKSTMPLFDANRTANTLPPRVPGWPVCRACRLALWTLPYGAWLTAGSATVLTCDEPGVEKAFVERNVGRATRIRQLGFVGLPAMANPETVVLRALRRHGGQVPVSATLWMFKNDNQDPWVRVTSTRLAVAGFLRRLGDTPSARHGWSRLGQALTRRGQDGQITLAGQARLAKALFDPEGRCRDDLVRHLRTVATHIEETPRFTVGGWRDLHRLYVKEMYEMDTGQLKPVTELITAWITAEGNPRGRFNTYRLAAHSSYELLKLLTQATGRLVLDGQRPADVSGVTPALLGSREGWLLRGQLFFEVVGSLMDQGVQLGRRVGVEDDEPDNIDADAVFGSVNEEDEEYA
jgi:CRISPR-associated protein Cst1